MRDATTDIVVAGIGGLGPWELGIILVIILIVFGANRLPGIGASIGQALKNFKKSIQDKDRNDPSNHKPPETKG